MYSTYCLCVHTVECPECRFRKELFFRVQFRSRLDTLLLEGCSDSAELIKMNDLPLQDGFMNREPVCGNNFVQQPILLNV
jgi:hypothetical protein